MQVEIDLENHDYRKSVEDEDTTRYLRLQFSLVETHRFVRLSNTPL